MSAVVVVFGGEDDEARCMAAVVVVFGSRVDDGEGECSKEGHTTVLLRHL